MTVIVKLVTLIFTDLHDHGMNLVAITQEPVSADCLTGNVSLRHRRRVVAHSSDLICVCVTSLDFN